MMRRLLLASASPRRAELLRQVGVPFALLPPPDIDETPLAAESPQDYVCRMAREKAAAGLAICTLDDACVMAADTTVVVDEQILGKPVDRDDAARMLQLLSGREHQVLSAVCICWQGREQLALSRSHVTFTPLGPDMVENYLDTGESMDKAGAYGIQGMGAALVARLQGSYSGVMGLPLYETVQLLKLADVPFWQQPGAARAD